MHIKDITVSEHYHLILLSSDVMTFGTIWKIISISIQMRYFWLVVLLVLDDDLIGIN